MVIYMVQCAEMGIFSSHSQLLWIKMHFCSLLCVQLIWFWVSAKNKSQSYSSIKHLKRMKKKEGDPDPLYGPLQPSVVLPHALFLCVIERVLNTTLLFSIFLKNWINVNVRRPRILEMTPFFLDRFLGIKAVWGKNLVLSPRTVYLKIVIDIAIKQTLIKTSKSKSRLLIAWCHIISSSYHQIRLTVFCHNVISNATIITVVG